MTEIRRGVLGKQAEGPFLTQFKIQKSKLPAPLLPLTITPQILNEGPAISIAYDLIVTVNTGSSVLNPIERIRPQTVPNITMASATVVVMVASSQVPLNARDA